MKTLAVCNFADLNDGQMRVFRLICSMKELDFGGEGGKVVVYRLGENIHATSAFCTHYGANLAKGVLTTDGRVLSACFNVCTGDIEDAPAPSAIHSFKTSIKDGNIYVTADPSRTTKGNMTRAPKLLATSAGESAKKGVVIIGGGSATFHAIESLREHRYPENITVLSKETYPPIDRTKLSKALITDPSKIEWRTAADLKIKYGTTLRIGVTVTSIDTAAKQVVLDGGKESIPYDKLILAPGGTPRRLPVEGAELENVYTFRGIEDSKKVDAAAREGQRMVVIGSSFISMELVIAVSKRKLASIDVIGLEEYPFEAVLGKEIGKGLKKYHESLGVKFHMQSNVEKIIASDNDSKLASGVAVNGEVIPADFVVMGVGVMPATDFLKQSGFELEDDGGIKVDQFLRVKGHEDVYAVGDIAWYPQPKTGESRRIEHWNVAANHGRTVGATIAGEPQAFTKAPIFWSAQGQQLRYCGLGADFDDVIIKGNPGEMKCCRGGKVCVFIFMFSDVESTRLVISSISKASELLRLGMMPSPDKLKEGMNILDIDISSEKARFRPESS
ncbi:hypothetical protein BJ138DRAFT_1134802 [Hygrophoropsis aurantiaca]|uniref:Uncharacterized protein n=1 Tax=Hygrophoropsis aurantiaca TaxID=72124 RepID=A0ACB8AGN9_9AGAM|nr:hypothetical protein BJ138DRAFT_1134802 [Hygrophoropsis aurantiaca]